MTKQEIKHQFKEELEVALEQSRFTGLDIYEFQIQFLDKALDTYAMEFLKECLPEEPEIETSPTCCKGAFSAGFVRCKNMMLIKAGIKKDLSNKDKK